MATTSTTLALETWALLADGTAAAKYVSISTFEDGVAWAINASAETAPTLGVYAGHPLPKGEPVSMQLASGEALWGIAARPAQVAVTVSDVA